MTSTVFKSTTGSDGLRSDRSARDRQRHLKKVRASIRENIADVIAEESIITRSKDSIVKIPIRGVKEYRFLYGENAPGVGQGDGDTEPGQVIGQADSGVDGAGQVGQEPGVDYYETDVTLDELIDILFEELELPDLERRSLREVESERPVKRKGFRQVGVRARLDKRRTARARLERMLATRRARGTDFDDEERFPFHPDDLTYRHKVLDTRPESSAVVFCVMDTSGSMDTMKKYLARTFFFLLYRFVRSRYRNVDLVFVAHHAEGREVTEEEFFHKAESGGTVFSSGYQKVLDIIHERYDPSLWNVYAFHCSDGDNFPADNPAAFKAAKKLCDVCNLFGYGEVKPLGSYFYEGTMLTQFRNMDMENFHAVLIERKEDVWPCFKALLTKERIGESNTRQES